MWIRLQRAETSLNYEDKIRLLKRGRFVRSNVTDVLNVTSSHAFSIYIGAQSINHSLHKYWPQLVAQRGHCGQISEMWNTGQSGRASFIHNFTNIMEFKTPNRHKRKKKKIKLKLSTENTRVGNGAENVDLEICCPPTGSDSLNYVFLSWLRDTSCSLSMSHVSRMRNRPNYLILLLL